MVISSVCEELRDEFPTMDTGSLFVKVDEVWLEDASARESKPGGFSFFSELA